MLEVKAYLRCHLAITGAAAAAGSATATTTAKASEAAVQREALTKEWRRQVADGRRQVYVIEQVLEVQRKLHAIALGFTASSTRSATTGNTTAATAAAATSTSAATRNAAGNTTTSARDSRSSPALSAAAAAFASLALTLLVSGLRSRR